MPGERDFPGGVTKTLFAQRKIRAARSRHYLIFSGRRRSGPARRIRTVGGSGVSGIASTVSW